MDDFKDNMPDERHQQLLEDFIKKLDELIVLYDGLLEAHNVSALLLSRVTLLQTMDPQTGKDLLKYVWEQLDKIQQANPGGMIP
jgi:hypothetical protein